MSETDRKEWGSGDELELRLMMLAAVVCAVAGLASSGGLLGLFMLLFGGGMFVVLCLCKAALAMRHKGEQ
jgi:hypothetical protein